MRSIASMKKNVIIKILSIIAIILLVKAISGNPYSYYIFMRWALCAIFLYCSYNMLINRNRFWLFIYLLLSIIYNPIVPLHMNRDIWTVINLISIVLILTSIFMQSSSVPKTRLTLPGNNERLPENNQYLPGNTENIFEQKSKNLISSVKNLLEKKHD